MKLTYEDKLGIYKLRKYDVEKSKKSLYINGL